MERGRATIWADHPQQIFSLTLLHEYSWQKYNSLVLDFGYVLELHKESQTEIINKSSF